MHRFSPLILLWITSACAPTLRMPGPTSVLGRPGPVRPPLAAPPPMDAPPDAAVAIDASRSGAARAGDDIAAAAVHYLSHTPRGFRNDCSGFVCAVTTRAGLEMEGNTRGLWELASGNGWVHHSKEPSIGDLVFFDQTYDRNRNGRLDDELTHVAVVIEIELDGTIVMAHGGTSQGRTTLRMNLDQPDVRRDATGRELNDHLRSRSASDPKRTRYLAGELWRAFATVESADGVAIEGS